LNRAIIFLIIGLFLSSSFVVISTSTEETILQISSISNGPMDSPWPMKSHDTLHTGLSPYSTSNNNGFTLWKFKTSGWMSGGIAIDNEGILYFGDGHWYLYALYQNGTLKWKYKTDGYIWGTPALAEDGTIYITTNGGNLYSVNKNGILNWKFNVNDPMFTSPVIGPDGTIYIGNHGIHAINPDGTEKWEYSTDWIYSDPVIGLDGTIYVGSDDNYLYAMNSNGTLKWKFKAGDKVQGDPTVGPDGSIYFGSHDLYLYALQYNGLLKWRYKINEKLQAGIALGKDGTIYCPDHDLYAFYPDGTLKWQFDFGDEMVVTLSSPAVSKDGTIYISTTKQGSSGGYIFAINPDGTEKWMRQISNYLGHSSPSIAIDGTIYIGSENTNYPSEPVFGYVYAIGKGNNPPNKPIINGPTSGKIDNSYTYTFSGTDEDNDQLNYYIDWGDGTNTGWKGPYNSGQTTSESHIWTSQGSYTIKAKAKDEQGLESDWTSLEVSMPKQKMINYPFVEWLLAQFPRLETLFSSFSIILFIDSNLAVIRIQKNHVTCFNLTDINLINARDSCKNHTRCNNGFCFFIDNPCWCHSIFFQPINHI
jgi:outer membrane protein assembly factor BamB